jgi:serine protease Do
MFDSRRAVTITARLVAAGVLVVAVGCESPDDPSREQVAPEIELSRRTALVRAVERVAPTVVGVWAVSQRTLVSNPGAEFFQRFFQVPRLRSQTVPQTGSGIVLDSRGFFLTNDHLVTGTENIWVRLDDGRTFEAVVTGRDPNYDLAVIQLKDQGGVVFDTSPLGDSDDLMVGEWVMAVGNPYGLYIADAKPSVTAGVVSALHRDIKLNEGSAIYKDMIQTDAAINPGNSGGPLVNAHGEVVGVNTFIFSQTGGGSLGIGFAIPINTAIQVAEELILYGQVRGVWIGIAVQELSLPIARQLGVGDRRGLVVWSLERGSPAERAGIRLRDIIRSVNGRPVSDSKQARRSIFGARVGDTILFGIERGQEQLEIPVTLEPLPGG